MKQKKKIKKDSYKINNKFFFYIFLIDFIFIKINFNEKF